MRRSRSSVDRPHELAAGRLARAWAKEPFTGRERAIWGAGEPTQRGRAVAPSPGYPVVLALAGRRCLVVGGGSVAEAKIDGLLRAGARVTVVSPAMTRRLAALAGQGALRHRRRCYRAGDLRGHALAVVATQDPRVTRAVAIEARSRRVWLNAADQPEACDFILPSVIRRGRLLVAVSTGGASPALARAIRLELEARLPAEYAALVEVVASVRAELRGRGARPAREVWAHALGPGVRRLLARGERAAAADFLRRALGAA